MKLAIKYFGMIAESAGKDQEFLEVTSGLSIEDLKAAQIKKYNFPDAGALQVAVNQDLNHEVELKDGDEIAFLPPFAGG